jgi:hypothetical protein
MLCQASAHPRYCHVSIAAGTPLVSYASITNCELECSCPMGMRKPLLDCLAYQCTHTPVPGLQVWQVASTTITAPGGRCAALRPTPGTRGAPTTPAPAAPPAQEAATPAPGQECALMAPARWSSTTPGTATAAAAMGATPFRSLPGAGTTPTGGLRMGRLLAASANRGAACPTATSGAAGAHTPESLGGCESPGEAGTTRALVWRGGRPCRFWLLGLVG